MKLHDSMRRARLSSGVSVAEAAAAVGISRATLYRYESGDIAKIPSSVVEALASVYRSSPSVLTGETSPVDPAEEIYFRRLRETCRGFSEIEREKLFAFALNIKERKRKTEK